MRSRAALLVFIGLFGCDDERERAKLSPSERTGVTKAPVAPPRDVCVRLKALSEGALPDPKASPHSPIDLDQCEKDLAEVQALSASGFGCIEKCPAHSNIDAALGCVIECEEKDPKLKARREKKDNAPASDRSASMLGWPALPKAKKEGHLVDLDRELPFTIELPEAFKQTSATDVLVTYELTDPESMSVAHLSLTSWFEESIDKAVEEAKTLGMTPVKKETKDGGFVLQLAGTTGISVDALLRSSGSYVKCSATLYTGEVEKVRETLLPFLARLCASVEMGAPKAAPLPSSLPSATKPSASPSSSPR